MLARISAHQLRAENYAREDNTSFLIREIASGLIAVQEQRRFHAVKAALNRELGRSACESYQRTKDVCWFDRAAVEQFSRLS